MYISKKKRKEARASYVKEKEGAPYREMPTPPEKTIAKKTDESAEAVSATDESAEASAEAESVTAEPADTDEGDGETDNGESIVLTDPQDLDTIPDESAEMTYETFLSKNTGQGALRVQVSAGRRSIPLVNVSVEVYKDFLDGRHIFYKTVTNADGVADGLLLPAPPRENSVLGNGASPYASYVVGASRSGLVSETVENVPVFSGVKSIQGINMSSEL